MTEQPQLHSSIVSLVSLAAGIAAKHPAMGMCQLERLRGMGVPEAQIQAVIEIARHIRDEAAQHLDAAFDEKAATLSPGPSPAKAVDGGGCCGTTPSGRSCC
jgi:hypothetical protein